MVSSMGGNDVGDVDGNVASKAGYVGDNCEMTSRGQSLGVVWNTQVV